MAQIKGRRKFDIGLPYPHRLDVAVDNWMKRHLPLVYQYTHWWVNWLSRPHTQSPSWVPTLGVLLILIVLIALLLLSYGTAN